MTNVTLYPSSPMTAEEILESGAQNIIIATGATWRRDGVGRTLWKPIQGHDLENVFSPDDLMDATLESRSLLLDVRQQDRQQAAGLQNIIIYDDDHYYMGGVLAELLAEQGCKVSLVTPAPLISYWSQFTLEQERIQQKLMRLGVKLYPQNVLSEIGKDFVKLSNVISDDEVKLPRDGVGRTLWKPIVGHDLENVFSPDDLMTLESDSLLSKMREHTLTGTRAPALQSFVIYDDDHYYMGGVLAELLATNGCNVSLVTPAPLVSYWSQFTLEQERIQSKLMRLGVKLYPQNVLSEIRNDSVKLSNTISEDEVELPRDGVVLVSDRTPNDSLYQSLNASSSASSRSARSASAQRDAIQSLRIIGDAEAPNIIAQAVFAGHLAAREFEEEKVEGTPFKVERVI